MEGQNKIMTSSSAPLSAMRQKQITRGRQEVGRAVVKLCGIKNLVYSLKSLGIRSDVGSKQFCGGHKQKIKILKLRPYLKFYCCLSVVIIKNISAKKIVALNVEISQA